MEFTNQKVPRKKRKLELGTRDEVNAVDRLSDLPDALLVKILALLYLKEAVRTSILSRRWKFLWMYLDSLEFASSCSEFVDKVLPLYKGAKIQNFSIEVDYTDDDTSRVDSWIEFAVSHYVEKLELNLRSIQYPPILYKLPKCFFLCGSLIHLKLRCCKFKLPPSTSLVSLKSFHIEESELSKNEILNFTSGCPVLGKLTLRYCNSSSPLTIVLRNPNLVELNIDDYSSNDSEMAIDAPYLTSLTLESYNLRHWYVFKSLASLTKATLNLEEMTKRYSLDGEWGTVLHILNYLGHAKHLHLCRACLQILSCFNCKKFRIAPFIKSQCLELDTQLLKSEVLGLNDLLQWCLNVENLSLKLQGGYMYYLCRELQMASSRETEKSFSEDGWYPSTRSLGPLFEAEAAGQIRKEDKINICEEQLWASIGVVCATTLHRLKRVQVYGFLHVNLRKMMYKNVKERAIRFRMRQVKLVRILLKNLMALDSIAIETWLKSERLSESSGMGKKLFSFRRASQKAQIVFL